MSLRAMRGGASALALALLISSAPVLADDIDDAIARGQTAYSEGRLADAKRELDTAVALIGQKNAANLQTFLPQPLDGWTANEGEATSMPSAMFGGGLSAERSYEKDGQTVDIQVLGDSPMMAAMMMMFGNPQMAAMSGSTPKMIAGQQALVNQQGEVQFLVANRFMVTVSGTAEMPDKEAYAAAIDFAGLSAFK
ncbi:MAG: hypothetical protein GC199_08220 [Alphaproteobacteria bacterium]|nr:hypothetical protein [Alphaproteobacteria bacterium]